MTPPPPGNRASSSCAKVGAGGRRTVETTYAWDVVGEGMMADYEPLLGVAESGATRR